MIRRAVLAGLLALGAAVPASAGGDPAAVAAVEAHLRDDEKAMLAAVLSDNAAAADFNADVKLAAGDAKVMKLVLDKWRGRIVAYAETDARIATPDVEGVYRNYGALMTPKTKAYLVRRLKTMKEDDRNSLIGYLDAVDEALKSNGGRLTWYTKKVVAGIFDKYREDLSTYLPAPIARSAKAAAPAAELALAELRKPPVLPPSAVQPVRRDPPATSTRPISGVARSTPTVSGPQPGVAVSTSTSALDQARGIADAAERGGVGFDGGGAPAASPDAVVADGGRREPPALAPSQPGGERPNIVGDVPSPAEPEDSFLSDIKKMKTGSGPLQPRHYLPGAVGALVGGILGFLLGGPVGAVIGAGVGIIGGDIAGGMLFK